MPSLEASAFLDGVPKGAQALRLVSGAGGGFESSGGRFSKQKATDFEAAVVCCHGGPGEDGTLQALLDSAGIRYTGPGVAAAALGMDKLAFGGVMAAAGIPALPRLALTETTEEVGFDGPYIVKPRFGGSSIGIEVVEDLATARALLETTSTCAAGAVLEPFRPGPLRRPGGPAPLARRRRSRPSSAPSVGRTGPVASAGEILGYVDKYVGGEGMASVPRELPAELPSARGRAAAPGGPAHRGSRPRPRGGPDRLPHRRRRVAGERDQHHPRLVGPLLVDRARRALRHLVDRHDRRGDGSTHFFYSTSGADGLVLRGASSIAAKLA